MSDREMTTAERRLEEALETFVRELHRLLNTGDVRGAHELVAAIVSKFTIETARRSSMTVH